MSTAHPPEVLIGSADAANVLGVSVRTVHRLVASGRIVPAQKLTGPTGNYLFRRSDVSALAATIRGAA